MPCCTNSISDLIWPFRLTLWKSDDSADSFVTGNNWAVKEGMLTVYSKSDLMKSGRHSFYLLCRVLSSEVLFSELHSSLLPHIRLHVYIVF
jgi:hypothetical protein